jgi:hypothetical protein
MEPGPHSAESCRETAIRNGLAGEWRNPTTSRRFPEIRTQVNERNPVCSRLKQGRSSSIELLENHN